MAQLAPGPMILVTKPNTPLETPTKTALISKVERFLSRHQQNYRKIWLALSFFIDAPSASESDGYNLESLYMSRLAMHLSDLIFQRNYRYYHIIQSLSRKITRMSANVITSQFLRHLTLYSLCYIRYDIFSSSKSRELDGTNNSGISLDTTTHGSRI